MFNERGLASLKGCLWERALLSIGDYLIKPTGRLNYSFLVNSSTDPASWKRLLRGGTEANESESRNFLRQLWDRLDEDSSLDEQLNAIIDSARAALYT